MLGVRIWGQYGISVKDQGSHDLVSECGAQKACNIGLDALGPKGLEPNYYSILNRTTSCQNLYSYMFGKRGFAAFFLFCFWLFYAFYYSVDQIKEDEMVGIYRAYGKEEKWGQSYGGET
jgi:hypothetical protein